MLRLLTPATFEPITLDEAKLALKVDTNADDSLITSLITMARSMIEVYTQAAIVQQSFRYSLHETARVLELPFASPLKTVDGVGYYDADETLYWLNEGDYTTDTESMPGRLVLAESPSVDLREYAGFLVEYTAGASTTADIPATLKGAVTILTGHLYENRERLDQDMPAGVKALLSPYCILGPLPKLQVIA